MGTITVDTTTTLSNLLPSYYDRVLLDTFHQTVRFQQFAEKKRIPTGEGKSITWNRYTKLDLGYVLTEGTRPSNHGLSTVQVSALAQQYGAYVPISDFVDLTAISDVTKNAVELLGKQAALTLDTVIQQAIIWHANTTAVSVNHYVKQSAQQYFSTAQSAAQSVDTAAVLAVSDVNTVVAKLRGWDVPGWDNMNSYIGITSPEVAQYIMNDSTWQNFHQYVEKGIENIYNGEIGRVFGCRFLTTTNNRVSAGSADGAAISATGSTSALAHATMIFGKQFFGTVDLGPGDVQMLVRNGADSYDPLAQYSTVGWKTFFTSKVLNVSAGVVVWSGINSDMTNASAASARKSAGLRIYDPSTSA